MKTQNAPFGWNSTDETNEINADAIKELALKVIAGLVTASLVAFGVFVVFFHPGNIN